MTRKCRVDWKAADMIIDLLRIADRDWGRHLFRAVVRRVPDRPLQQESRKNDPERNKKTLELFEAYNWPGNIREL